MFEKIGLINLVISAFITVFAIIVIAIGAIILITHKIKTVLFLGVILIFTALFLAVIGALFVLIHLLIDLIKY